jgi:hypothetical protein
MTAIAGLHGPVPVSDAAIPLKVEAKDLGAKDRNLWCYE